MIRQILLFFRPDPLTLRERFLTRFAGKTLIVHAGLTIGWVSELLKEAGGGAHFRLDARQPPTSRPTPIEWVVHAHILPQKLPLPLLIKVESGELLLRHLVRNNMPVHPSEIYWMLGEFPDRCHLKLSVSENGFARVDGMPITDNFVDFDAIFSQTDEY